MKKYSFEKGWDCDDICHMEEDVDGIFYTVDEVDTEIWLLKKQIDLLKQRLEEIRDITMQ